jgi:C-terminal processing protease CtpA/Prc
MAQIMKTLTQSDKLAMIRKIKKLVLKYHINVGGVDYDLWGQRVDERAPEISAGDQREFETGVRALLAELRTSHTGFFHDVPDRLLPQHTLNATVRKVQFGDADTWMFLDVIEGGPAAKAGIRPGELLIAIDGSPVLTSDIPMFGIGEKHTFTLGGTERGQPRDVQVEVPVVRGSKAHPPLVPPKMLSHRMLQPGIGYLRVGWFTASMGLGFSKELDTTIADLKQGGCQRLIIDLRGNIGGGLGFARLASYMCPGRIPIGQSLTPTRLRSGYDRSTLPSVPMPSTALGLVIALTRFIIKDKSLILLTQGLGPQPFHGNIVVLVNEFTNSAAEMVANFALENSLATVVGTKTCGTVLGARNFGVGGGYWARLPVFGWFTSTGGTIEGTGVSPDHTVDPVPTLLASGGDAQLSEALKILSEPTHANEWVTKNSVAQSSLDFVSTAKEQQISRFHRG